MTNGVFNNEPVVDEPADQQDGVDYKKRYEDSQAFIAQLKQETAEMREVVRQKEIEAEAQRILEEAQRKAASTPPAPQEATPASREPAKSEITPEDLVERVLEEQQNRAAKAQAEANALAATERLVDVYGTEQAANKAVRERAQALGVGVEFLLQAAQKSPIAFYELMELEKAAPINQPAPRSDVNTAALKNHAPGAVKPGTPEYYDALRKEIGDVEFYKPKIQQQRMKDMQAYYASKR